VKRRTLQVAVLTFLLTTRVSTAFSQTVSELKDFLSQRIGLSRDKIAAIQHGKPFATNVKARSEAEVFLFGVVYVNAAPDSFLKYEKDLGHAGHLPGQTGVIKFSDPPQLSDLQGFGFDNDDVKLLKDCKPGDCKIQIPASTAMDDLRKSVHWGAPNADQEVNQLVQKLALARLLEYQKEGNRIFGLVYNLKGQQVSVNDLFKNMLSYYQVFPRDLPELNKYILDYPNAKPANVENTFYWERLKLGPRPMLRIMHVLTMHGDKTNHSADVIAERQLYSSHYLETALDLTFIIPNSEDRKQPGFYLVKAMSCEQVWLTGLKRTIGVSRSVSDLQKSLASAKESLEHQK